MAFRNPKPSPRTRIVWAIYKNLELVGWFPWKQKQDAEEAAFLLTTETGYSHFVKKMKEDIPEEETEQVAIVPEEVAEVLAETHQSQPA